MISRILTNIETVTTSQVITLYLPFYASLMISREILDFFTRKYSEAMPENFKDHLRLRIYKSILKQNYHSLRGYSKERLQNLVEKYLKGVDDFLLDWVWIIPGLVVSLIIIVVILAIQSPVVLAINVTYITVFLVLAFRISGRFGSIANVHNESTIDHHSVSSDFELRLNTIRSLFSNHFYETVIRSKTEAKWFDHRK